MTVSSFPGVIKWSRDGLIPVVTVDCQCRLVLMQTRASRQALASAIAGGRDVYRFRRKHWRKREESRNLQRLVEVLPDCDKEALCYRGLAMRPATPTG